MSSTNVAFFHKFVSIFSCSDNSSSGLQDKNTPPCSGNITKTLNKCGLQNIVSKNNVSAMLNGNGFLQIYKIWNTKIIAYSLFQHIKLLIFAYYFIKS